MERRDTGEDQSKLAQPTTFQDFLDLACECGRNGAFEKAIAFCDQAIAINPNDGFVWLIKGISLANLGRYVEAIESYDKAIAINPEDYQAWRNRGFSLANLGRYVEAIESYDKAIAINPDDYNAWRNRGISLANLGRYVEAIESYDKAIAINPDDYNAWRNRGFSLANLGRYVEAIESYDKAIAINPEDYQAWGSRGISLANLGRYVEAIESCDKAIAINPEDYQAWRNRGISLANLGRYVEAIESYDKAIAINPEDYQAWGNRGISLANLGRYVEAIESCDKAIAINPEDYQAWRNRGFSLANLGRYVEAIESYDKAIAINPDDYNAWHNRGFSLRDLGRYVEAIESYEKAIAINPENYSAWLNRATAICNLNTGKLSKPDLLSFVQEQSIPALKQSEPHIAALQESLPYLKEETADWASIHLALGDAYLDHSRGQQNPAPYWRDAIRSYQTAYPILKGKDYLSVLQGLVRAYLALENISSARRFQQQGQSLFQELLSAQSEQTKDTFVRKFISFSQLEIELLVGEQNPTVALEQAEFYKNRCLTWILDSWQQDVKSPTYDDIRGLLSPTTAIVYWHLGVESLTTFLVTHDSDQPIVLPIDRQQQAGQFRRWLGNYDSEYRTYAGKKSSKETDEKQKAIKQLKDHPWRISLENRLASLKEILNTSAICNHLPDDIQTLILVPHRDLHRLPLQLLFPNEITCTFYPSLKIGLQHQARDLPKTLTPLLNVDDPQTDQAEMRFARIESAVIRHLVKDSTAIHGDQASLATVSTELQKEYKTFHFTGHGAYNSQKPAESSLGLVDGLLNAKQIGQLDLSSYQLVCLAACETALTGNDGIPDEYVGLASAFLKAGATNVLSTLWPVDEVASAWIMIRFYQNLLDNHSPAIALKSAQQWLKTVSSTELSNWIMQLAQLDGLPPVVSERLEARAKNTLELGDTISPEQPTDYHHPYYWAAFTLIGQG